MKGFSLLETLIVIAILAVLAAISSGIYWGFIKKTELDSTAKTIIFDLKNVRAKSMAGESGLKWGARFVNAVDDYYETFSTPTTYESASTTIEATVYLPSGVSFTNPVPSSSSTIIFNKIRGTIGATTTISASSTQSDEGRIITITPIGNIY